MAENSPVHITERKYKLKLDCTGGNQRFSALDSSNLFHVRDTEGYHLGTSFQIVTNNSTDVTSGQHAIYCFLLLLETEGCTSVFGYAVKF